MAKKTFRCKLITPEAQMFDQPAVSAVIPVWDGSMGILPDRAPLVAKLGIGELRLDFPAQNNAEGGTRSYLVEGGFAHMVNNSLTILASRATAAERLTEADAQAELAEAQARKTEGLEPAAAERIRNDRDRARQKLALARSFRSRGGGI